MNIFTANGRPGHHLYNTATRIRQFLMKSKNRFLMDMQKDHTKLFTDSHWLEPKTLRKVNVASVSVYWKTCAVFSRRVLQLVRAHNERVADDWTPRHSDAGRRLLVDIEAYSWSVGRRADVKQTFHSHQATTPLATVDCQCVDPAGCCVTRWT